MFHAANGFYFARSPNGDVTIIVRESAHRDAPALRAVRLTGSEWASVVASVSHRGERLQTFIEAVELHEQPL